MDFASHALADGGLTLEHYLVGTRAKKYFFYTKPMVHCDIFRFPGLKAPELSTVITNE